MQAELENKMDLFRREKEKMVAEMQLLNDSQHKMSTQFRKIFTNVHVEAGELKKYEKLRDNFQTIVRFLNLRNELRDTLSLNLSTAVIAKQSHNSSTIRVEFARLVVMTESIRCAVVVQSNHEKDQRQVTAFSHDKNHEKIIDPERKVTDYGLASIEKKYADVLKLVTDCKLKFLSTEKKKCKKTVRFDISQNTLRTYELLEDEVMFKRKNKKFYFADK